MIFFTFEFIAFFAFVLVFNWALKPWPRVWRLFLLLASYYFYSVWDLRLLPTLVVLSFFNYAVGNAINSNLWGRKRSFLILGIIFDLFVLGIFKYYDFFRLLAQSLLGKLGFALTLPLLELVVAAGISFYLFKILSFLVDCYRDKIGKYPSLLDFSLYVAFFPQLLSGPIARAQEFLPQLENGGAKKIENLHLWMTMIMVGLFKKLLIVNYLTTNITDDVFIVPQNHGSLVTLLAILAYTLVIYFDLSSYTDMAIGFSGLMGLRTPPNFDSPYAALTIQEFWRKWHITLSNWVRDYIYIPLGGSRKGKVRQFVNLVAAMTAMGFWHGAAGHYVFWGFLQGTALSATAFFPKLRNMILSTLPGKFFSWLATFIFVMLSWIFFRVESVGDGFTMIGQLFSFQRLDESFKLYVLIAIIIGFIFLAFEQRIIRIVSGFQQKMPLIAWIAFVALAVTLLFRAGSDTLPSFIYFNF
jgi:D-alanyl-lipoteichoic acid acyltransferase DltB (MBOAT superfamily)